MLFATAKLNQKLTESPKSRCHLFIRALKGQFFQIFHEPATCNVRIQAVGKVHSSAKIHGNSVLSWNSIGNSRERSGSVVECLTRDRRAAGSSLTGVTVLCP